MKVIFLILLALGFSLSSTASEENVGGQGTLENIFPLSDESMSLPDFAERLTTPQTQDVNSSTYTCRAWTNCPGGFRISCWSRGYRCYSEVTPGYRVYCSATSRSGRTNYWVYYCY
ncbi:hypothetical protein ACES2L_08950 [Bdellovibrio bacteriovorus]